MRRFARRRAVLALGLAAPLGGCGVLRSIGLLPAPPAPVVPPPAPPPPSDYALALTLVADEFINPDPTGRPSPLRVLVHVGERDPRLAERGFAAVFGAGPGARAESGASGAAGPVSAPLATLVLAPGARETLTLSPPVRSTWVTVSAAYREPWSALWTVAVRVDSSSPTPIVARFGEAALTLDPEPDT